MLILSASRGARAEARVAATRLKCARTFWFVFPGLASPTSVKAPRKHRCCLRRGKLRIIVGKRDPQTLQAALVRQLQQPGKFYERLALDQDDMPWIDPVCGRHRLRRRRGGLGVQMILGTQPELLLHPLLDTRRDPVLAPPFWGLAALEVLTRAGGADQVVGLQWIDVLPTRIDPSSWKPSCPKTSLVALSMRPLTVWGKMALSWRPPERPPPRNVWRSGG